MAGPSYSIRLSRQLEKRDLRPCADPDGKAGRSDAAVHIELCALFFVPPPDVGHPKQATQVEAAMDQIKRQLAAAVNVARQRQVNPQLGVIEEMRVVSQQDVDCIRHHQPFDPIYGPVAIARFY